MKAADRIALYLFFFVVSTFAILGALHLAVDLLPPPVAPSCSCANKPECEIAVFNVDGVQYAYCSLWGEDQNCCVIIPEVSVGFQISEDVSLHFVHRSPRHWSNASRAAVEIRVTP